MKFKLIKSLVVATALFCLSSSTVTAASYSFSPDSGAFSVGCQYTIRIISDASSQSSNSAEIFINYSTALIGVIDQDTTTGGIQLRPGVAYEGYIFNNVDSGIGQITLLAASTNKVLNSSQVFAQILFSPTQTGIANFDIDFEGTGVTTDSNIADTNTGNDLLTSVSGASYTIDNNPCTTDTSRPIITFVSPTPNQQDVPLGSSFQIQIEDDGTIDSSTLSVALNGTLYDQTSPELSISASGNGYLITIDPGADMPLGPINLQVLIKDTAGNASVAQTVFNNVVTVQSTGGPGGNAAVNIIQTISSEGTREILDNTIFKDTFIGDIVSDIGIAGTGALIGGFILALNLLPLIALLNAPGLLLNLLGILLGRKQRRPWGIIQDGVSSKPIAFATCRLFMAGTINLVNQTVSDTGGRYGFAISPGSYRLEVTANEYQKFSKGIEIAEGESGYVYDVFLKPLGLTSTEKIINLAKDARIKRFRLLRSKSLKILRDWLLYLGLALSIISVLIVPNIFNYIILGCYVIVIGTSFISKLNLTPKYAAVIDSQTGLRIPFATVKIFGLDTSDMVDTQLTNQQGQFDFWGEAGNYAILVSARGYRFPSKTQTNLWQVDAKYLSMLKVKLTKGRNRIQLFVDPIEDVATIEERPRGNLPTPFG